MAVSIARDRWHPTDAQERVFEEVGAIAYLFLSSKGQPAVLAYSGKRRKPDLRFSYPNEARREAAIEHWLAGLKSNQAKAAAKLKERASFFHTLKMGDILYSSWGYEQTNVDFYQVVRVPSNKAVVIRELNKITEPDSSSDAMTGRVTPCKDSFSDGAEELTKRVREGNAVRISSFAHATPWDGLPKRYSTYA